MNGNWHELKQILHNESELKKIHCAKPAENRMRPPNSSTDSSELDTWQSWASWRTAAEAVGGRRPDVGRRRMVGGRHGRLTVRKSKNQPKPATVAVTVTETTARALRAIQPNDPDPAASLFGLTGETLANRVRAAAQAAGLGEDFSGHSGRIGMARRMVAAGAPNAAVQRQGRWKHGDMVARYTRGEVAGEALKWLS